MNLQTLLDEKARVRTLAGVARYHRPIGSLIGGGEATGKKFFHGTTQSGLKKIAPANEHRRPVVFASDTDKRFAYATGDESNAWVYAEKAWHAGNTGVPRVYEVAPLGDVEKDPPIDEHGRSRSVYDTDVRSHKGFRVLREVKMPEDMGVPDDWKSFSLEEKTKYVRTPAGVARYHKPIGSPIGLGGSVHIPSGVLQPGEQAYGGRPDNYRLRGRGIDWDDPKIPDTVYHVSTNAPAVRQSGMLRAGGVGGLGGDPTDKIVSLTISRDIALDLKRNMQLMSRLARKYDESNRPESNDKLVATLNAQARSEGWSWSETSAHVMNIGRESYSFKDWVNQYYNSRQSATNKPNPLFFSTLDELRAIDPDKVGILPVPRRALDNGSQLTDFDLGQGSLEEVRAHGDVLLKVPGSSRKSSVPKIIAPGSAPIPEGHIRLFHYSRPQNVVSIREHGLQERYARGDGNMGAGNEPSAGVWASTRYPKDVLERGGVVVEFHATPDQISQRANHPDSSLRGRDRGDIEAFQASNSHVIMNGGVARSQFVAIHEPWHDKYRYMMQDPDPWNTYKYLLDDEYADDEYFAPYRQALAQIKREQHKTLNNLLGVKVRHVRTLSGVQRYHLPIGSPIVARPDVPVARRSRPRRHPRNLSDLDLQSVANEPGRVSLADIAGHRQPPPVPRKLSEIAASEQVRGRRRPPDPIRKARASEHVLAMRDEMRDRYDGDFGFWDTMAGNERPQGEVLVDAMTNELLSSVDDLDEALQHFGPNPTVAEQMVIDQFIQRQGVLTQQVEQIQKFLAVPNPRPTDVDRYKLRQPGFAFSNLSRQEVFEMMTNKVVVFDKDANGRQVPPQEFLDAAQDIKYLGSMMNQEIDEAIYRDPEVIRLRGELDEMFNTMPRSPGWGGDRAKYNRDLEEWKLKYQTPEQVRAQRVRKHQAANPIDIKKGELARAHRRVKLDYLNSVRPMGPHPEANPVFLPFDQQEANTLGITVTGGNEEGYRRLIEQSFEHYPTSWIAQFPNKYYRQGWSDGPRAFHKGPPVGSDFQNPPPMPFSPAIVLTPGTEGIARNRGLSIDHDLKVDQNGFGGYHIEAATHEVGHGMEIWVPGIAALTWAEMYSRANRNGNWESLKRMGAPYLDHEVFMEDSFTHKYAGKSYMVLPSGAERLRPHRQNWEMFTTGIEDTFGRTKTDKLYTSRDDQGVQNLVLGMMASLNYFSDEEDWRI